MKRHDLLYHAYASSPVARVRPPQRFTLIIEGHYYRGIGRYPLNADYQDPGSGWQWSETTTVDLDATARARLREIVGADTPMCHDNEWLIDGPWLIPSFEQAVEVLHLVSVAEEYELVEVAHHPVRTRRPSIGFDIGYWASGNFPIICDSLV